MPINNEFEVSSFDPREWKKEVNNISREYGHGVIAINRGWYKTLIFFTIIGIIGLLIILSISVFFVYKGYMIPQINNSISTNTTVINQDTTNNQYDLNNPTTNYFNITIINRINST